MKRLFILFLLILSAALMLGCTGVISGSSVADKETVTSSVVEAPPQETVVPEEVVEPVEEEFIPQPTKVVDIPVKKMSVKLQALLDKARGLRPNFDYVYYDPSDGGQEYHYSIYKSKQLVRLPYPRSTEEIKFNYVLLDTDAKTAEGYCTYVEPYQCRGGRGPFELDYAEWHRPSVQDWIKDIEYAEVLSDGFVSARLTKVIEFERDGMTYRMDIDAFYGLPLKIVEDPESDDPVVHKFNDLLVSNLDKEDVVPSVPAHR